MAAGVSMHDDGAGGLERPDNGSELRADYLLHLVRLKGEALDGVTGHLRRCMQSMTARVW